MNNIIYEKAQEFIRKYPGTVAFRIKQHAKVASIFIGEDEEVKYVFLAQKNHHSLDFVNTNIIVLTDKRLLVATKRLMFGYFFRMITPDMFNDLTIKHEGRNLVSNDYSLIIGNGKFVKFDTRIRSDSGSFSFPNSMNSWRVDASIILSRLIKYLATNKINTQL